MHHSSERTFFFSKSTAQRVRARPIGSEWCHSSGMTNAHRSAHVSFSSEARYDRDPLDPARVAKMSRDDFNLSRPFCDIRGEIDGFSWLLFTRRCAPHIAKQAGVWRGTFRRVESDGRLVEEFPAEIIMRVVPRDGQLRYHQTNVYRPASKPVEALENYGEIRDGKIHFGNARLDAWKMDVPGDTTGRSAVLLMEYKDGSDMYMHQIVSLSDDGRYRSRTAQYLVKGKIVRRTLIDEEKSDRRLARVRRVARSRGSTGLPPSP